MHSYTPKIIVIIICPILNFHLFAGDSRDLAERAVTHQKAKARQKQVTNQDWFSLSSQPRRKHQSRFVFVFTSTWIFTLTFDISRQSIWSTQAHNWKLCFVSPSSSAQSASIVASLSARSPAQAIGRDVVNKVRGKNSRYHPITMRVSRWYYHPISGEQNMGILPTCREDQEENVRQAEEQLHKH